MAEIPGQVFDFEVTDSTLVGMLQKINSFTDVGFGGSLGILIILVVSASLYFIMRPYGNERALPVALLIASLLGLFLRLMSLIGDVVFWICVALLIVSVLLLFREQGQYES